MHPSYNNIRRRQRLIQKADRQAQPAEVNLTLALPNRRPTMIKGDDGSMHNFFDVEYCYRATRALNKRRKGYRGPYRPHHTFAFTGPRDQRLDLALGQREIMQFIEASFPAEQGGVR